MLQNYVIMARLGFSLAKGKVHKSHNERWIGFYRVLTMVYSNYDYLVAILTLSIV
jgi:hypothetical protein